MGNAHLQPHTLVITEDVEHVQQVREPVRVSEGRLLCHPLEAEACVRVGRAGVSGVRRW